MENSYSVASPPAALLTDVGKSWNRLRTRLLVLLLVLLGPVGSQAQVSQPARRGQAAVTYSLQGDRGLAALTFGSRRLFVDLDKDGDKDVFYQTGNTSGSGFRVQLNSAGTFGAAIVANDATGTFSSGPLSGITFTQLSPPGIEVVDLDNDGDEDLVEYQNSTTPRLLRNNGDATFTAVDITSLPAISFGVRHLFVDLNNDGAPDILYQTGNTSGSGFRVQLNNGNGTFAAVIAANDATGTFSSGPLSGIAFTQLLQPSLTTSDLDDDGDEDLVDYQSNTAPRLLRNNGNSTYTASTISSLPSITFGARFLLLDIESDGDQDILYQTGNTANTGIRLQLNNGDGTFAAVIAANDGTGTFSSGPLSGQSFSQITVTAIVPVDYDVDGDADLVEFLNATTPRSLRQDATRPQLASTAPADNATGVSPSTNLVLTFDRSVVKGNGNLYLVRTSDNVVVETVAVGAGNITGSGTTWTYDPTITLANTTSYAVRADEEIFIDADGRTFVGIFDNTTYNFTTGVLAVAPTVTTAAATTIAPTSATLGGNVTADGGATVTERGVVYVAGTGTPTTSNTKVQIGTGTGSFSQTITGLTASTQYTVRAYAINSAGTSYGSNITFTTSAVLAITPASQTNVSCFGGSNGAASVNTATGGVAPYTYNWTPGNPTGDGTTSVTGLTAGTWTVTVTDATNATATQSFTITQPPALAVTPASQTNISCFGGSNGAASINLPTGGVGGYTYNWTPGNPTGDGTRSVTGLTAGTWTVTVTDANSCTATQSFTITQPASAVNGTTVVTNVACFGGSNGAINLTPTGGVGGYTFLWNNGATTEDRTGLTAGTYSVTITDANSCTRTISGITITQPASPLATTGSQTNVTTNGGSDGTATVSVSGGTSPYTYSWSPSGGTGATASGLTAGTYTVTVTDANGCTTTRSFTITQPTTATVVSVTRLNPSPTATAQVSYRVVFSGSVSGVTVSNFSLTTTGISGAAVSSASGSGTTYTVVVNTGTGDGTLRLNVDNSTGVSPTVTGLPYTSGEQYTITKSFAAAPTLRIQAAGSASGNGDVTAFVDVVQVLQSGTSTVVANGLQNGSFESNNVAPSGFKKTADGVVAAPWSFTGTSGVARYGSPFDSQVAGKPQPLPPNGDAVALIQSAGDNNASVSQNLAVPTGSYQVSFQTIQRYYTAVDQRLNVFVNDVFVGNIQPNNTPTYESFTSAPFSVTAPALTATVSTTSASPTSTSPIPFTVSFSQSVGTTFTASDVTVAGGTLTSGSFAGSGSGPYSFTVTPTGAGSVSVSLAANVALDANNTGNAASNAVSVQYVAPTIVVNPASLPNGTVAAAYSQTLSASGGTAPYSFAITAGTLPTGLTLAANGTLSGTPAASGTFNFTVTATDASGTPGPFSGSRAYSLTIGAQPVTAAPVVTTPANGQPLNTTTPTYSGTAPANSIVTVYVDGSSIGTTTANASGNFSLTQPTALSQGSHTVYATAQTSGSTVSANSNTNTFTVDTVRPSVAISSSAGASSGSTATSPIPFTVTFSENVTGFVAGDVTVTNGTITGSIVNGTSPGSIYTFTVTPAGNGIVTVSVPANVAQDAASNFNTAASSFSITYTAVVTATSWTGAVSSDWFTAANWSSGVPTTTVDATIPAAAPNMPGISASTATAKALTLNPGSTLTQTGGTLNITANLTNSGTFQPTGGTVSLGSTTLASILGSGNTRFWNLTVGASGAQLSTSANTSVQRLLTLNGNFVTNGNPFTLESNASATAMVVNSGGSVVGTATMQRYIDPSLNAGLGYRHYSSPVQSTTVSDLATAGFSPVVNSAYNTQGNTVTPFPTVYGYDEARITGASAATQTFEQGYFSPTALTDALAVGRGYTVNIGASEKVDLTGTLNTGAVSVGALSRGPEANAGWQLLGNPYPAPLDWSVARAGLPTGVQDAIYVYKSADQYNGTYQTYVNGVGSLPSGLVPAMQGFFLRVSQNVPAFSFQNAWRATTYQNPTFNRSTADTRPLVQLDLVSAQGTHEPAFVYFEQGATAGFDARFDAEKLANPTGLNLSSSAAGLNLAVNGLPAQNAATVVPLAVGVPTTGTYSLQAASLANLGTTSVYLHDAVTGQQIDLRQQPSYAFSASNAALITSRFSLRFGALAPTATKGSLTAASVSLYPNPAHRSFTLSLPAVAGASQATLTLYNVLGQPVRTTSVALPAAGVQTIMDVQGLPLGVYVLRIQAGSSTITKSVVVD
ncbi:Por secretion system C-terminal sorting domain-containing protein [Hymenobacter daecheongensis DSM 21074]|uniref:Por secretion system C-terminal sorting domain-containing protein n=1 Tax=Hymenobacter daecheongensis DSM 21074 TaxID=1121955 RepID=A0A1M6GBG8_9BACT|nr:FG-GAP-like repeat-containing protein [Hymenobacter daecheongensis]SHJ07313.1 Por secretion system C-terminal sorting domain-containing protein [Hymenobacter daecheongensis DSM 21074]